MQCETESFPVSFGALDGNKGGIPGEDYLSTSIALLSKLESVKKLWRQMDKPHGRRMGKDGETEFCNLRSRKRCFFMASVPVRCWFWQKIILMRNLIYFDIVSVEG